MKRIFVKDYSQIKIMDMKKLQQLMVLTFALVFAFSACDDGSYDELNSDYNQLLEETNRRDSAMLELVQTLNQVDRNLELIKEKENIINLEITDEEHQITDRERMVNNIQEIYSLMEENKGRINELNASLDRARSELKNTKGKLSAANQLILEYQSMIENLNGKIALKDEEILQLKDDLEKMNVDLANMTSAYQQSEEKVASQKDELNTAYYAFGTKKELIEQGVISKKGGLVGIGSVKQLKTDFNQSYFTRIDISKTSSIDIYTKKAEVITSHDEASYHFTGTDGVDQLIIDDPKAFWSASKYLVLIVQ